MIGKRLKIAVALSAAVIVITGCSSLKSDGNTFEIVGEAEDLTPEQEAYIRRNGSLMPNQVNAKQDIATQEKVINISVEKEKSKEPFLITRNESLYSVINRLTIRDNYSRFIFDLSPASAAPDLLKAHRKLKIKHNKDALLAVENLFQRNSEYLRVFTANDNGAKAIVVSDKPYPSWLRKSVHTVDQGTLQQATEDLAQSIGWKIGPENGYQAQNFKISNSYPLIITPEDAKISFTALLNQYPARALLNPNTKTATIVTRVQPKTN
jgi:hypothetical protein